jgi:hypothetical protein
MGGCNDKIGLAGNDESDPLPLPSPPSSKDEPEEDDDADNGDCNDGGSSGEPLRGSLLNGWVSRDDDDDGMIRKESRDRWFGIDKDWNSCRRTGIGGGGAITLDDEEAEDDELDDDNDDVEDNEDDEEIDDFEVVLPLFFAFFFAGAEGGAGVELRGAGVDARSVFGFAVAVVDSVAAARGRLRLPPPGGTRGGAVGVGGRALEPRTVAGVKDCFANAGRQIRIRALINQCCT